MSKYNTFVETGDKFIPYKIEGTHQELPSGCYIPEFDWERQIVSFNKLEVNCDGIIDLPSNEYEYVVQQMNTFLRPETKQKYLDNDFIYKRSVLLHGKPGTGKTVIVNRVTREALKNDAVVLFNPDPRAMTFFFEALNATAPEKLTLVIFEEFDDLVRPNSPTEKALLSILDGEVQKRNIIYLATTNYIENVPLRIQRPGRFSSIVEVGFPSVEARKVYLQHKRVDPAMLNKWIEVSEGFSVDELKETVLAVKCLDEKLDDVVSRIKDLKDRGLEADPKDEEEDEFDVFGGYQKHLTAIGKKLRR